MGLRLARLVALAAAMAACGHAWGQQADAPEHRRIRADGNPHVPTLEERVGILEEAAGHDAGPHFPSVRLTGFFHLDGGLFDQDAASAATLGDIQNGVGFRRARLQAVGSVTEFTHYSLEMDFATPGRPSFQDVWVEQQQLPFLGTLRIGHFRQPVSMDSWTSIRQLTFLERALPFQAFDPFRRVGIMAYNHDAEERTTWQYSVYRTGGFNNGPIGDSRFATDIGDIGGYSFATRATRLLFYDEPAEGRYLVQVGGNVAYSRNTGNGNHPSDTPFYQSRVIPEFFVGDPAAGGAVSEGTPFFADTGRIASSAFMIYGVHMAGQWGSAHFLSEYMVTTVDAVGSSNLFYDGAYAQAGYFLTGEHRSYNRALGAFDRVVPIEEFFSLKNSGVCGWGAWEVAARLSHVDLNDPDAVPLAGFSADPGRITSSTLGLNWYWNTYTKVQLNWIHLWVDHAARGDSDTDIFAARTQLEF